MPEGSAEKGYGLSEESSAPKGAPEETGQPGEKEESMSRELGEKLGIPEIDRKQANKAIAEVVSQREAQVLGERGAALQEGARKALERGGYPPIAGGEPWLYEREEDLEALPDELRKLVRKLEGLYARAPDVLTEEILRNSYLKIEDFRTEGEITEEQADHYQEKIYERIQRIRAETPVPPSPPREAPPQVELPQSKEEWIKEVRRQLLRVMRFEVKLPGDRAWVEELRMGSGPELTRIKDPVEALKTRFPEIANESIQYEYGRDENGTPVIKEKSFAEILKGEIQVVEALHKRFLVWRTASPTIDGFEKILAETGEKGGVLDPDKLESLATLIPDPGETEAVGDLVDRTFKLYREVGRGNKLDPNHKDIFTEFVSENDILEVRTAVMKHVTGEPSANTAKQKGEYAEEIAFRLIKCWGEAAWVDVNHRLAGTESDATAQLMDFENWRVKQAKNYGTKRFAGPSKTLKSAYPKRLMVPFLRLLKTQQGGLPYKAYLSELIDMRGWRLRDIDMHRIEGQTDPDEFFLLKIQHATKLFQRLTILSLKDIHTQHFQEFNTLVDRAIHDQVVEVQERPDLERITYKDRQGRIRTTTPAGSPSQYWSDNEEKLKELVKKWRRKVRLNYVKGIRDMSKPGGEGDQTLKPEEADYIINSARGARTIGTLNAITDLRF